MKKIVVATDFSPASRMAARYAADMAIDFKATLELLHVVHLEGPPRAMLKSGSIEDAMVKAGKLEAKLAETEIAEHTKGAIHVRTNIKKGFPVADMLNTMAGDADLLVVGTHGASEVKRALLGSVAASVINNSLIPVIAVPEEASYGGINRILYATDLLDLVDEVEILASFAKSFRAIVDALYVNIPDEELAPKQQEVLKKMKKRHPHPEVHFHSIEEESVIHGIDRFAAKNKSDLVAMFSQHQGFFQKLFGHSETRRMAFHSKIPLLAFRKDLS